MSDNKINNTNDADKEIGTVIELEERNSLNYSYIFFVTFVSIVFATVFFLFGRMVYYDNYNVDYYKINLDWDGELKHNFKMSDKYSLDNIRIKQTKKGIMDILYTESISKEEFLNLTEEEYVSLVLNILEQTKGFDHDEFKIIFEDKTFISYVYERTMNEGIYRAENKPNNNVYIGSITYDINDNHTIYNVNYEERE